MDLFSLTVPHVNQESNDILLLDFSAGVDGNQNCLKDISFLTSPAPDYKTSTNSQITSSTSGYFPVPDSDPFGDDPLSSPPNSFVPDTLVSPTNNLNITSGNTIKTDFYSLNRDTEHSQQINVLSSKSIIFALNNGQWPLGGSSLQLGPPATSVPAVGMWGTSPAVPAMFPMPGIVTPGLRPNFPQPTAFGVPMQPPVWAPQMVPQFSAAPLSPPHLQWGQPATSNPFQAMGDHGPSRPPPRPPVKETPPRVENSAFTALDPLGDKEKKTGKDMFKNFQIAKLPAIPARKGELMPSSAPPPANKESVPFDEYFSNKVGLAQDAADHDDFDINQMSILDGNGKLYKSSYF
ncbi:hypothetical protein XENOCAPTIV_001232 [Xenoophorus captivus]|uniref:DAB adaptor protein 2 n=1 Tax=Xenoophorus captivus TaxID=1517983 RepID=A0ABV0Q869_9TELE